MLKTIIRYVCIGLLVAASVPAIVYIVNDAIDDITRSQASYQKFVIRCRANHGTIINMKKSNISRMCVALDGRIVDYQ